MSDCLFSRRARLTLRLALTAAAMTALPALAQTSSSAVPDAAPRAIASSHAYEAYLMAWRAIDAGDIPAAKNWLKQVLVFDPAAREPRNLLAELERRERLPERETAPEKKTSASKQKARVRKENPKRGQKENSPRAAPKAR